MAQQYNFNPQGYDPLREWLRDLTLHVHPGVHLAGSSKPQQQQPQAHAPASSTPSHAVARDLVVTSGAIHAICAAIACLTDPGDTLVVVRLGTQRRLGVEGATVPAGREQIDSAGRR